jgi:hypothetical protein
MVPASQGDPTMQINFTVRTIDNGILVADGSYDSEHLLIDSLPRMRFFPDREAAAQALPELMLAAFERMDQEQERMKAMKPYPLRRHKDDYRHPVGWDDDGSSGAEPTPPDDGDPHLVEGEDLASCDACGRAEGQSHTENCPARVDEGEYFIRDKPVMDTSAFGQRDEGPAEK